MLLDGSIINDYHKHVVANRLTQSDYLNLKFHLIIHKELRNVQS